MINQISFNDMTGYNS